MVRKRIIVRGNVQGAGYRALVKLVARTLGLKGKVRNLDDGTVEIFCDGEESVLEVFLSKIDIKHSNGHLLAIDVREMEEHTEGTDGYKEGTAPDEFGSFAVDYGQDLGYVEQEMLERQELLIFGGSQVLDGLAIVGEKVDTGFTELGQKVDGVGEKVEGVGLDVRSMHKDMNERFDKLDEKYDVIGTSLIETNQNHERMNENNAKTNENITKLIEDNSKTNENITKLIEDNSKTNENITKLIEENSKTNENITKLIEENSKTNENIKNFTETMMKIVDDHITEKRRQKNPGEGKT